MQIGVDLLGQVPRQVGWLSAPRPRCLDKSAGQESARKVLGILPPAAGPSALEEVPGQIVWRWAGKWLGISLSI